MATLRVLLADDHAEFRRVVCEFLKKLPNVNVVGEAGNGREAVEQVARLAPDIVLMDISMPEQNGIEATRIIKQRWPATRVLIATTHDSPIYRLQAKEAKADLYVMKSDLKSALEKELGVAPGARSSETPVFVPKPKLL
ncbi:MAG TPA: response regulator transcription factor [Bacteroidota bacterium]